MTRYEHGAIPIGTRAEYELPCTVVAALGHSATEGDCDSSVCWLGPSGHHGEHPVGRALTAAMRRTVLGV